MSLDGSRNFLATASTGDPLRIWSVSDRNCVAELFSTESFTNCMQIDSKRCLSGSPTGDLIEWDISQLQQPEFGQNAYHDNAFRLYPSRKLKGHTHNVTCLEFDDFQILSGSMEGTIRAWDLESGITLSVFGQTLYVPESSQQVSCLHFDEHALTAGYGDGTIKFLDLRSGLCVKELSAGAPVSCITFNDKLFVSGSKNGSIQVWDVRTGSVLHRSTLSDPIEGLALDQTRLYAASGHQILVSNPRESTDPRCLVFERPCTSLLLSQSLFVSNDRGYIVNYPI